jgi:hypothetical protein
LQKHLTLNRMNFRDVHFSCVSKFKLSAHPRTGKEFVPLEGVRKYMKSEKNKLRNLILFIVINPFTFQPVEYRIHVK